MKTQPMKTKSLACIHHPDSASKFNNRKCRMNLDRKRFKFDHAKYPNEDYSRRCVLVYQLI